MPSTPRQFRYAGPMRLKDTSDASLMSIRRVVARHPAHIKYVAIYKMNGSTMVLARAQDKLSVAQWWAFLEAGVEEIKPIKDLTVAINLAKRQDGFEEYGSMGKKKANAPRVGDKPVETSPEQVVRVVSKGPSPEPVIVKVSPEKKQGSVYPTKNPYMSARLAFFKTMEGIRQEKKKQLNTKRVPADLSLPDYKPKCTLTKQDMVECNLKASMRARAAYIKYLEDYSLRQSSPAVVSVKHTIKRMV